MFLAVFMVRKGKKKSNLKANPPWLLKFLVFSNPPTIPHPLSIRDLRAVPQTWYTSCIASCRTTYDLGS